MQKSFTLSVYALMGGERSDFTAYCWQFILKLYHESYIDYMMHDALGMQY